MTQKVRRGVVSFVVRKRDVLIVEDLAQEHNRFFDASRLVLRKDREIAELIADEGVDVVRALRDALSRRSPPRHPAI